MSSKKTLGLISSNGICHCHKLKDVKLLTRICIDVSNLCRNKRKHSFQDLLNRLGSCRTSELKNILITSLILMNSCKKVAISIIKLMRPNLVLTPFRMRVDKKFLLFSCTPVVLKMLQVAPKTFCLFLRV